MIQEANLPSQFSNSARPLIVNIDMHIIKKQVSIFHFFCKSTKCSHHYSFFENQMLNIDQYFLNFIVEYQTQRLIFLARY
jgi:hypothetical protein